MKGILFDLDGTLVDSLADLASSAALASSRMGYPTRDAKEIQSFVGNGVYKLVERLIPASAATEENILALWQTFQEIYPHHCLDETRPYTGIPEVLQELKVQGYRLGVVSNKPDELSKHIVKNLFSNIFDVVKGQRDDVLAKPDPALANEAIREMGLTPGDYYFIGDSGVDMQTAKNCGAISIGVTWGFRTEEEIIREGALHLAKTPEDILRYTCPAFSK